MAAEHRQFFHSPQFSEQKNHSIPSFIAEPEIIFNKDDKNSLIGKIFYRHDFIDSKRSHLDIRQADWTHLADNDWELRAGISKVYWGVMESRHLVDVINQTDYLEDIDEEDKLGQPMVQLANFQDWGTLRFFYLPYFRDRDFTGKNGRLRSRININNKAQYGQDAGDFNPSFATRYEHSIGDWDIGLAQFYGTGREAKIIADAAGNLSPFYEVINQSSADIQLTKDAWLLKSEAIYRSGQGRDFVAISGGFEYSIFGIFDSNHDLGLLAEYHHDDRSRAAPSTIFDRDLFLGSRYVLNNAADTEFLAGITIDTINQSTFSIFEAAHRLNNSWKVEFDARIFNNMKDEQNFAFLQKDDFAQLRLSYFF